MPRSSGKSRVTPLVERDDHLPSSLRMGYSLNEEHKDPLPPFLQTSNTVSEEDDGIDPEALEDEVQRLRDRNELTKNLMEERKRLTEEIAILDEQIRQEVGMGAPTRQETHQSESPS
jgi:predicted transcriptional regulator